MSPSRTHPPWPHSGLIFAAAITAFALISASTLGLTAPLQKSRRRPCLWLSRNDDVAAVASSHAREKDDTFCIRSCGSLWLTVVLLRKENPFCSRNRSSHPLLATKPSTWISVAFFWMALLVTRRWRDLCSSINSFSQASISWSSGFLSPPGRRRFLEGRSESLSCCFFQSLTLFSPTPNFLPASLLLFCCVLHYTEFKCGIV